MPVFKGPPVSPLSPQQHVCEWSNAFSPFDDDDCIQTESIQSLLSVRARGVDSINGSRRPSKESSEVHNGPREFSHSASTSMHHINVVEKGTYMDESWVQHLVGFVIICNLLCIGMEIGSNWSYWNAIELGFLCFYTIEFVLRFMASGYEAAFQKSLKEILLNMFDLMLVVAGVLNFLSSSTAGVRNRRLLLPARLLRTVRIFRLFDVLSRFVGALQRMAHSLSWIFSVIALIVYVFAIYLTQYVNDFSAALEDAGAHYSDVSTSMFTLFQVTTMDSWMDVAGPLIECDPLWRLFFVTFIVFTAWTMISLLTAVVSDTVISATYVKREEEKQMQERRREEFVEFLKRCFRAADTDGNGLLDREEFLALINEDIVSLEMERLGVAVTPEELRHTFDMLDIDESGELSIEEFTKGLLQLQQSLSIKHVVAINYAVERAEKRIQKRLESQQHTVMDAIQELHQKVDSMRGEIALAKGDKMSRQVTPLLPVEELEEYPT